jgi:hypothetical protein
VAPTPAGHTLILSTSTASRDRGDKKAIYARNGVREYWLVDPRARELLVLALDGDRYREPMIAAVSGRCESRVLEGSKSSWASSFREIRSDASERRSGAGVR